jgi:NTE family protein
MRVLILGGGGTLGAFSAGALRVLAAAGWQADAYIGSSAGSINLLRTLAGGPDAPARFWATLDWKQLVRESLVHNVRRAGLLNPERFHARVDAGVDYEALWQDRRPIGFIVVDLATGGVRLRGNRTEGSAFDVQRIAHASFAVPPLLPPVRVHDRLLADGGLLYNAPLDAAWRLGATEIVYLCNVQVLPPQQWSRDSTLQAALRYAEIFARRASNVGFADAHITEGRFRGVPFLSIAPPPGVRAGRLLASMLPTPRTMQRLIRNGEIRAREALALAGDFGDQITHGRQGPHFAHTGIGN